MIPVPVIIKMYPDYGHSLFWESGACIGNPRTLSIEDEEIDLSSISGLEQWYQAWDNESLCHTSRWSDEEWRDWWTQGLRYAQMVKRLLPSNIELDYFSITDKVWKIRPEDTDDGGVFDEGEPIRVVFGMIDNELLQPMDSGAESAMNEVLDKDDID